MMIKKILTCLLPQSFQNFLRKKIFFFHIPVDIRRTIESLNNQSVCVDCGANVGIVSDLFASYGAHVYAFEPDPHAFAILEKKAAVQPRIKPIKKAVGLSNEPQKIYFHKEAKTDPVKYSQGSSLIGDKPNVGLDHMVVDVEPLSTFLKTIGKVDILKIDIEGYETVLLPHLIAEGALDHVDHIYIETHDHKWTDLKDASDAMRTAARNSPYHDKISFEWV